MNNYTIFDNKKLVEQVRARSLATPCYIYDTRLLEDTFAIAKSALDKNFKKCRNSLCD